MVAESGSEGSREGVGMGERGREKEREGGRGEKERERERERREALLCTHISKIIIFHP